MKHQFELPLELETFRGEIEKSIRPYIHIYPQAEYKTEPWESKIGGIPYLPKGMEIPNGENGDPLFLLAQINFSDTPNLAPFPTEGLLQIFIADHNLYGANMESPTDQQNFRIRFFGNIDHKIPLHFPNLYTSDKSDLPISPEKSFPLKFETREEAAPLTDFRIHDYLEKDFFAKFGARKWEVMEAYSKKITSSGHRLGGYSFFTQNDPRENHMTPTVQLLQIDSDQNIDCNWGDMGTAHFFIKKEALEKLDFSEVAFWWDSY